MDNKFTSSRLYAARGTQCCTISDCSAPYYGAGFCKKHHQWHWKRGLLEQPVLVSVADKIRENVVIDDETGCWIWQGHCNNKGYGRIWAGHARGKMYAHRASYMEFHGPLSKWMIVRHKCDTPPCVNPAHLECGTMRQNSHDSIVRGRAKHPFHQSGSKHPRATLTREQVLEIRSSDEPLTSIATRFGVHKMTVRKCKDRITYQDIA